MKYIVAGQNKITGKVAVSGSPLGASALVSLALLLNDNSKIENAPSSFGFDQLFNILVSVFSKTTRSQDGILLVDPSVASTSPKRIKIAVDIDNEVFFALPAFIFKNIEVILDGSSKIFNKHKNILDLLKIFGLVKETNSKNLLVIRPAIIKESYYLDFRNRGGPEAFLAILFAISLDAKIIMVNYPQDPLFKWFLGVLVDCNLNVDAGVRTNESDTVCVSTAGLPTGRVEKKVSFNDNLAAFYTFLAMGTQGDITLSQVNSQDLMPFCAKILSWGAQIDSLSKGELRVYMQPVKYEDTVSFEVKPYPGFVESWSYLALVFLLSRQIAMSLIFPNSSVIQVLLKELNRMGANLDFKVLGNFVSVTSVKKSALLAQKIILDERELLLPYLLLSLLNKGKTVLIGGELIDSYYPGLIDNLKMLGANISVG
ncbi:MAG: hypothetical protein ABIG86_00035 [Patescibacteria group bacterium]